MPLSKEETQRAVAILESILSDLGETVGEEEGGYEDLLRIQTTVDVMKSPLFTALVDIRNQIEKNVTESKRWGTTAEVKLSEEPELVEQFCQRYGISGHHENGVDVIPSKRPEEIIVREEEVVPPVSVTQETVHRSPNSRISSEDGIITSTLQGGSPPDEGTTLPTGVLPSSSTSTGVSKKKPSKGVGVTLADLARGVPSGGHTYPLSRLDGRERSEGRVCGSSESSLTSMSSEPSTPQPLPPSTVEGDDLKKHPVEGDDLKKHPVEGDDLKKHPMDLLFFMRDKKSLSDIKEVLHGRHGRSSREVRVTMTTDSGLGMDLTGLSDTGVFVSELVPEGTMETSGLVRVGDQILQVNGRSVENMADFEVEHLIKNVNSGEELVLLVQYNPAGLTEYRRVHKK